MSAAPLLGRSTARASAFAVPADCPPGTTAPVPPAAKGPAIPAAGYLVEEIADRVYWLTDGLYQMIFVATADGVVAVDAPPTIGNNILRAIATVERGLNVQAGEDVLNLAYHGPNHSPGNIFINLPAQRVLMLVDVVFPGWVPFAYLAESQNIPGWLEAPAVALNYPFDTYVGGHLTRLGTRNDVIIQQEYVTELKTQAANAIATFNPETVYQAVDPTNPWAIFRGYLDGVAAQAASAVVPNWIDRLGGADVYTLANAYQMVESLRIDCGQLGPFGIHP
jgi:glyoxylase-like metal-dependent hydrolase (beta-lactamase superfamily II)